MKDSPRHPGTASVSREQNIRTEVHQKYQPQISQIFHIKETHLDPQNTIWCNFPKLIFTNSYTLDFLQLAEKPWICFRKPSWHQNCPVFPMNVNGQLTKYHSWFTQGPLPFYIHPSISSQVFRKISSAGWRWKAECCFSIISYAITISGIQGTTKRALTTDVHQLYTYRLSDIPSNVTRSKDLPAHCFTPLQVTQVCWWYVLRRTSLLA